MTKQGCLILFQRAILKDSHHIGRVIMRDDRAIYPLTSNANSLPMHNKSNCNDRVKSSIELEIRHHKI